MFTRSDEPSSPGPAKRKTRNAAWGMVFIAVAALAATAAAYLLTRYMDSRVAAARVPTVKVVVAQTDIPIATPIKAEWLAVVDWPAVVAPQGALSEPGPAVGKAAFVVIARGDPVTPSKLAAEGARGGLATLLPDGMRAEAVRVDDVVGVAGFIHPNDHVDVLVTMQPREGSPFVSKIVLQNVPVLAVGKDIEVRPGEADKAKPVTVATLMVSSEDSERLALAASKGQILLTLRGLGDEEVVATTGMIPSVLYANGYPEPPRPAAAVAEHPKPVVRKQRVREVAAAPPPHREKREVEILRGDLFEKRNFEAQEAKR